MLDAETQYLAAGETVDEIIHQHPMLERADITACLEYASRVMVHGHDTRPLALLPAT